MQSLPFVQGPKIKDVFDSTVIWDELLSATMFSNSSTIKFSKSPFLGDVDESSGGQEFELGP